MTTELRIGILGCGPIAQFAHLEAARKARNVTLRSVCDADRGLAKKMGIYYEAHEIFNNYQDMLDDPDLDAVVLGIADEHHLSAATQAIRAGKHVLLEKPLGADLQQSENLKDLVNQAGVTLQVGHMKRFDPGIRQARSFIQNELGEMVAYKAWYCDSTHRYDMTNSTQPLPFAGLQTVKPTQNPKANPERYNLLAHGSHLLDTARFLVGPIRSVQARLVKRNDMYCWFVDTEFSSGCNGHLDLTVAVRMDWHEGFQVYGQAGSVLGKIYNPWYFKTSEVQCFSENDGFYRQPLDNKAHFFQLQMESFAATILDGVPQIGTDIYQGIESIQAMIAISRSAETGERVQLKDVRGSL